jgi:hypothetical protein
MFRPLVAFAIALFPSFLFASTDLILFVPPTESRIPAGGTIGIETQLFNTGPDVATNTVITFDFPSSLTVNRFVATIGQCDTSSRPLRCTLGDLAPNETRDFRFSLWLGAPHANLDAVVTINVTSDAAETHPASNTVTRSFHIIDAVNLSLQGGFTVGRVDPGATVQARTSIANYLDSHPSDIHLRYEVTSGTIERIDPPAGWTCTIDGSNAECRRASLDPNCRCGGGDLVVTVRTSTDRRGGVTTLKASATSSLPEFYPGDFHNLTTAAETYRWFVVTNTNDHGSGSLREAIDAANSQCGEVPCKIAFEIPGPPASDGAYVIAPSTSLPPLTTSRIFIDGRTQTAFGGDSNKGGPEISLDGRFTRGVRALEISSSCEAVVEGLAVGNFDEHALFIYESGRCATPSMNDARRVANNYIGTDARGTEARPNLRGVYVAGSGFELLNNIISANRRSGAWVDAHSFTAHENLIGVAADRTTPLPNGASGLYLTGAVRAAEILFNRIWFNDEMGVAVDRAATLIDIRQNSMKRNGGLGIDIGLDGRNAPEEDTPQRGGANAPILFSATYDAASDVTIVTGALVTAPLSSYSSTAQLDVYANESFDGDGETWLGSAYAVDTSGKPFTITIRGDQRDRWLNATSTRVHFVAAKPPEAASIAPSSIAGGQTKTSEFSNAVRVE